MITDDDVKKIKESFRDTFVTKDDLTPIKESLRAMNKKLDLTISFFDKATASHEPRLKTIETHLGILPVQN